MVLHCWHSCSGSDGCVPLPAAQHAQWDILLLATTQVLSWGVPRPPPGSSPLPWGQLGMLSTIQVWLLHTGYRLSQLTGCLAGMEWDGESWGCRRVSAQWGTPKQTAEWGSIGEKTLRKAPDVCPGI